MKRIAGLDYGDARIGFALSDPQRILSTPIKAIPTQKTLEATAKVILEELLKHEPIGSIVIGLPLMMSGKESPGSQKVRELAKLLETMSGKTIILWDERLTTAQVERTLKEVKMNRKKRALHIDAMAASLILQTYLDSPCNK